MDLAVSVKTQADYTCIAVLATDTEANLYLLDMVRGQWEWPDARKVFIQTVLSHDLRRVGVEEVAFQLAAIQDLRREPALVHVGIQGVKPDRDKLSRAMPWATRAEQGKFFIARASWNAEFLAELSDFPHGQHDDQVDAVSGAVGLLYGPQRRGGSL